MAGIGKLLTRGLGAAMTGYGKTLLMQDERAQKQRELDGVMMREQALADYKHKLDLDTIGVTADSNAGLHAANAAVDTAEEIKRLGPTTDAKQRLFTAENDQKFRIWKAQQSIEFRDKLSLEQQRQAFEMAKQNDQQAAQASLQDDQQQHDLDSNPIGTFAAADGTPVAFYGRGATNRYTKMEGAHMPEKSSDESGGDLQSYRRGGGGRSGGRSSPSASSAPAAQTDYSVWNGMKAEAANHPAFKGLSVDERMKRLRDLAQSQNIPIPPDENN